MKNLKKVLVAIVLFIGSLITVQAQDIITMKSGETMEVKITELDENKIKYYEYQDEDQLIFTVERALIKEIQFGFGKKHVEVAPTNSNPHYFTGDRRNALKVNFSSIGNNSTILTYERSMKPEYSLETSVKIVGLGIGEGRFSGVALDFGPKFKMKSILRKSNEYRPRHLLHGGYFKPTVGINFLQQKNYIFNSNENDVYSKNFVNLGIDFGKQWIISNVIAVDAFIGFHYLAGKTSREIYVGNEDYGYPYEDSAVNSGDLAGSNNRAVTFGVKVGFLFDGMKKK